MSIAANSKFKQTWVYDLLRRSWIGDLLRGYRGCKREFVSLVHPPSSTMPTAEKLATSLAVLQAYGVDPKNEDLQTESPIFLLSTGWRAGSTLLQRVLVTDPNLLLWGEPLGEMTIVSKLADILGGSISERNLELWKNQQDPSSATLATSWVANLYPPGKDFRGALRSLQDRWLGEPARRRGFSRWGFKEVRLGATEATLLHWLYPSAKFVIISRHPYDAYRSLADARWGQVYYRYPDRLIESATDFARHWNHLAVSWSELPAGFPCVHIKYEDLVHGKVDFRGLESWLGLQIKEDVALSVSVGGTAERAKLAWYERWMIAREAKEGMRLLGYSK